jgi:hypothetical protein
VWTAVGLQHRKQESRTQHHSSRQDMVLCLELPLPVLKLPSSSRDTRHGSLDSLGGFGYLCLAGAGSFAVLFSSPAMVVFVAGQCLIGTTL